RVTQGAGQLACLRRWIVAAEHDDPWQRLERLVITLRIDDTETAALKNRLLAQQPRQPRFARPGLACNQHRSATNRNAHLFPIVFVAEPKPPPSHLTRR